MTPDDPAWSSPPVSDGSLEVRFRVGVERIAALDTVAGTAFVQLAVTLYWTDPRLAGWEGPLPQALWGPILVLKNQVGDASVADEVFALVGVEGRLKRGVVYRATVGNPMDLHDFPFDLDDLDVVFHTSSHWRTRDGSQENMVTAGRIYVLREVEDPAEGASRTDPFSRLEDATSAQVHEWTVLGYSHELTGQRQVTGIESQDVVYRLHIARKPGFYVWRVLLPLAMIGLLDAAIFAFPPDDFGSRMGHATALVLASVAMLYVVGELVPRIDHLTRLDQVVVATLGLNALTVAWSLAVRLWPEPLVSLDPWVGLAMVGAYAAITLLVLVPAWLRHGAGRRRSGARRLPVGSG